MGIKEAIDKLLSGGMIPLRQCSICSVNIGYVSRDGFLLFDSGCGCSERESLSHARLTDLLSVISEKEPTNG